MESKRERGLPECTIIHFLHLNHVNMLHDQKELGGQSLKLKINVNKYIFVYAIGNKTIRDNQFST